MFYLIVLIFVVLPEMSWKSENGSIQEGGFIQPLFFVLYHITS